MTLSKFCDLLNQDCEVHFVANLIENGRPVDLRFTYKKPNDIDIEPEDNDSLSPVHRFLDWKVFGFHPEADGSIFVGVGQW
jgi:hypothetical protein